MKCFKFCFQSQLAPLHGGVYLKLNATLRQVAAYEHARCGGSDNSTMPAVRAACDALVECIGFTFISAEGKMCHSFIMEEYVFTQGKEVTGSMPASLVAQKMGAAAGAYTRPFLSPT
jgi:hypothetical protein